MRVEEEAALVEALEEHHPHRRGTVGRRRRERHCLRHVDGLGGFSVPPAKLLERIGDEIVAPELGHD
jgi:hypothetical protein